MSRPVRSRLDSSERGAATLVIVMVLFLVMALLAAYANRSMLFEQRIANSYFRASLAQEVAEAGLEWAVAQLNGGSIDTDCLPVAAGGARFADRYLAISAEDRGIKQASASLVTTTVADCRPTANGWSCHCPALGAWAAPAAAGGTDTTPSFGITIQPVSATAPRAAGTIWITSLGCTSSVASTCSSAASNSRNSQGVSQQNALIALVSAVRSPPAAPLVVKGNVTVSGAGGLALHNTDPRSAGLLYDVGGTATGFVESRLHSVPGTSANQARVAVDDSLTRSGTDMFFRMFMGATVDRYKNHPSLRTVACNGDCAADLADAYAAGRRIIWVNGPLRIESNRTIGSVTDPVVIVASGDVTLSGAFELNGLLLSRGNVNWTNGAGTSRIVGMLLAEGNVTTDGAMDIVYQPSIASQLRNRVGSFVRVPGGWKDLR